MRATDIIRNVLDLIDNIDCAKPEGTPISTQNTDNISSFKQIFDLLSTENPHPYDNSPDPVISSVKAVTVDAGGGWNGPKQPSDLRGDSFSLYPNHQHKPGV